MSFSTIDLTLTPLGHLLLRVGQVGDREGIPVFAVGGFVRDLFLGRQQPDYDVDLVCVGPGSGIKLAGAIATEFNSPPATVYQSFGTASVRISADPLPPFTLEFVGARKESYRRDSRKPIVENGSLDDDLRRRDFTINAMAIALNEGQRGEFLDPFSGLSDLEAGLIKTPLPAVDTFDDDPLRMIRAARFTAQLGFGLDDGVFFAMQSRAERLEIVSQERITDELRKIVLADKPSTGFKALMSTGILELVFPELTTLEGIETVNGQRHKDNFYHTLQVLDNLVAAIGDRDPESTEWLRWAALMHDIGKPTTKRFTPGAGWTFRGHEEIGARLTATIFRKLKLPTDDRLHYVQKMIRLHHRPTALADEVVTDSAVRRLLFEAGDDVDDLMTLVRADITSKNARRVRKYLSHFDHVEARMVAVEESDRLRDFQPPVDGKEIMEVIGLNEGVAVGIIKDNIREAILDGQIPNEHDAAFVYMMSIKDESKRRASLFREMLGRLTRREQGAMGAIKEVVFFGEIPLDHDEALKALERIKDDWLEERRKPTAG